MWKTYNDLSISNLVCFCVRMCVFVCIYVYVCGMVYTCVYVFVSFPMSVLLQFRYHVTQYSNEILSDTQSGQTLRYASIPVSTFCKFEIMIVFEILISNVPMIFSDVLVFLEFREYTLVYLNQSLLDLANWPKTSICIHTCVHIFKIWNYDCFLNNIFRCPNDNFLYFVVVIISTTYFGIFLKILWHSRSGQTVHVCACVCVCVYVGICLYICVCMCVYVHMSNICMYVYLFRCFVWLAI